MYFFQFNWSVYAVGGCSCDYKKELPRILSSQCNGTIAMLGATM